MADFRNIADKLVSDLKRDFGFTDAQAIGLVGNLAMESNGFSTLQEISPTVPGSRGGYGYAQWTGPRRRAFDSYVASNKLDPTSYEANYGFLKKELAGNHSYVVDDIKAAKTSAQAAKIAEKKYLIPGVSNRSSRLKWTDRVESGYTMVPGAGMESDGVYQLQTQLKGMGFDPGTADGVMGPRTKAAIKEFQKANGLTVDGIVGPQTATVLAASSSPSRGADGYGPGTAPAGSMPGAMPDLPRPRPNPTDPRNADYSYLPMPPPGSASMSQVNASLGTGSASAQPSAPTAQPGMMGRGISPALEAARQRLATAREIKGAPSSVAATYGSRFGGAGTPAPKTIGGPAAWTPEQKDAFDANLAGFFAETPTAQPVQQPYSPTMPTGGPGTVAVAPNIRPGVDAPVPMARNARPTFQPTATAAATPVAEPAKQQTIKVGKNLYEVGSLHKIGNDTFKIIVKPDGTGGTEKVNIDLLDEKNTIAGGMVGDAWQKAVQGAKADAAQVGGAVVADVGAKAKELAGNAGSFLTNLFSGGDKAKAPALSFTATPAANTNAAGAALSAYANKGWGAGIAPVANPVASTGLAAPGAGLTQTQQQQMRDVTKYRQVVNPAYTAFMAASGSGVQGLSPDERDEASAQRAKLMPGVVGTGIAAKAPAQYIQQAYTEQVAAPSTGAALSPTRSAAPVAVQPKIYSSGGYLFAPDGKGGHANIGRDYTYRAAAGSRGTAAGSDNNSKFETTAVQRANYDRQGISY